MNEFAHSDAVAGASRQRKRRRIAGLSVVAVVLVIMGTLAYFAHSVLQATQAVRADVNDATFAVRSGDTDAATAAVSDLISSSGELSRTTRSAPGLLMSQVPVFGASVSALGVMADSVNAMARSAEPIVARLSSADSTTAKIAALGESEAELRNLASTMQQAQDQLAIVDSAKLRFGLAEQAEELVRALPQAIGFVNAAADAAELLPDFMGVDGARTWLVLLQNPAEARGSGGLFSGYALVQVSNGSPAIVEANSRKATLDDETVPKKEEIPFRTVASTESVDLWGKFLAEWSSFNTSADFPTVAQLAMEGMEARGTPVDGVIALDPYMVQALLGGTGPVEHRGVIIDGTNAGDFFTRDLYAKYPDFDSVEAKDELALGLVYATIDSLLKRPLDFPTLISSLPPVVAQGHVKAWSPRPNEQEWFQDIGVAGDIASLDPGTMMIAFNNAVGGKLDAYVTPSVEVERGLCVVDGRDVDDYQMSVVTVTLRNDAPEGLPEYVDVRLDDADAPPGSTRTLVHVYGPADAAIEDVLVDGEIGALVAGYEAGRPVWGSEAEILRDQSATLRYVFVEPRGSASDPAVVMPGTAIAATVTVKDTESDKPCSTVAPTLPELDALLSEMAGTRSSDRAFPNTNRSP